MEEDPFKEEIRLCSTTPTRFVEKHCSSYSLYPWQIEYLQKVTSEAKHQVLCSSIQVGSSTMFCFLVLWGVMFKKERTVLVADSFNSQAFHSEKIQSAYYNIPNWMKPREPIQYDVMIPQIEFFDKIISESESPVHFIVDHLGFYRYEHCLDVIDFFQNLSETKPHVRITLNSRIVQYQDPFHKFYERSMKGLTKFQVMNLPWYSVPKRTEKWVEQVRERMSPQDFKKSMECQ